MEGTAVVVVATGSAAGVGGGEAGVAGVGAMGARPGWVVIGLCLAQYNRDMPSRFKVRASFPLPIEVSKAM